MFVKGLDIPCKGCTFETGRQVEPINCHSYCEKYLKFCEANNFKKQIKKDIKQKENDYYGMKYKNFKRGQK